MEIRNHEYYVSFEIAKLLKEAGFDWELETCYIGKSVRPYKYHKFFNWNKPRKDFEKNGSDNLFHAFITQKKTNSFISAPTLEVVKRWLREVKGICLTVQPLFDKVNEQFNVVVGFTPFLYRMDGEMIIVSLDSEHTYEEALEAGIKKALELILEKGE